MKPEKQAVQSIRERIFTPKRRMISPLECVHAYTRAVDEMLRKLFNRCITEKGQDEHVCLVALGGYGRGELSPYSDVDIMLLYSDHADAAAINAFERAAWDSGLLLGYVARTIGECRQILGDDFATDTALLETTHITGSMDMYTRLIGMVIRPYFRRRKSRYLSEMRSVLVGGVFSTADTLYRIEPDIKNGICCLRDCHRMIWSERVAGEAFGGQSRPVHQFLSSEEERMLSDSYAFLLKIRSELHMLSGRRLDVLEVGLQPEVAQAFGYGKGGPAKLMSDFFKTVSAVKQCVLSFSERVYEEQGILGRIRSMVASFNAGNGLQVIDGILHLKKLPGWARQQPAVWTMEVFLKAITCHAEIGTGLRNRLREIATEASGEEFSKPEVTKRMRTILSGDRFGGRIITLMHETAILEKIIPEFAPLTCLVEFDTYHEYTVDQHTLLALQAMDELIEESDDLIQRIYLRLNNKDVLRLALLMHDCGKALPGDHSRTGSAIAEKTAVRLGFGDDEVKQVAFLVRHHLLLSELSFRRELEDGTIRQCAKIIHDHDLLDMLFLLTVLDIRHVGKKTWTGWKAAQMREIFSIIETVLENDENDTRRISEQLAVRDIATDTLPEGNELYGKWLDQLEDDELQMHTEAFSDYYRVTLVTFDRAALLSDIAACFITSGLHIVSARVHSFKGGKIIDIFDVQPDEMTRIPFVERLDRFKKNWRRIQKGNQTSAKLVETQLKNYPRKPLRQIPLPPKIVIDNTVSPLFTIIEVHAPNRFGLFYTLVTTLSSCGVNINAARIATALGEAVDAFYVSSDNKGKIEGEYQIENMKNAILENIT